MTKQQIEFKKSVKNAINAFSEIESDVFYTTLALFDICGITNPTLSQCNKAYELTDDRDTIYDEFFREDIQDATGIKY